MWFLRKLLVFGTMGKEKVPDPVDELPVVVVDLAEVEAEPVVAEDEQV